MQLGGEDIRKTTIGNSSLQVCSNNVLDWFLFHLTTIHYLKLNSV